MYTTGNEPGESGYRLRKMGTAREIRRILPLLNCIRPASQYLADPARPRFVVNSPPGRKWDVENTSEHPAASADDAAALEQPRAEREKLAQRQLRLAELLKCPPEKIEHEVRNVLNELKLLRTLFGSEEKRT